MAFFSFIFGTLGSLINWMIGRSERQIGKEQQQNADLSKNNTVLKQELAAAVKPVDTADSLRRGDY